ncbi:MAG: hypothetical protein LLG45_13300 [Actinomycetia bacterium]|nr:hypothetical protein [Actinomycetes bacterium]
MYSITIDGENVDGMTVPGSVRLSSTIGVRTTGSLVLQSDTGYRPHQYDEVYFYDTEVGKTVFGGELLKPRRKIIPGSDIMEWTLRVVDFSALADRRRMYASPEVANRGELVRWIITHYLAEFGVTAGDIEDGGSTGEVRFNGQKPSEALTEAADFDGFVWIIDDAKRLHYLSRESYTAPWNITDANPDYIELSVEDADVGCNVVYYRGSANGITDERTESYAGDGARREFAVRYKMYQEPTVKVNGVAQTVGIYGIESGKQWYWNKNDKEKILRQDSTATLLTSSDTLTVTYVGLTPIMVMLEDKESIAQHGRFERLVENAAVQRLDAAISGAETEMRQNPFEKVNASFRTYAPGLRAGMIIRVQQSAYDNLDTDILITSVDAEERTDADCSLEYAVEGVSGERREDWVEFYRLLTARSSYEVRPDETIAQAGAIEATVLMSHQFSVISRPQWIWGTSIWGGGDAFW